MAIYYTSSTATGGGDGSISNEWTLAEAFGASGIVDGDTLLVKADGTYNLSTKITVAIATYDWEDAPIVKGANADGTDDGTTATINGSGITADDMFLFDQSGTRIQFFNIRFTAATSSAISITNNTGATAYHFQNCRIDNSTGDGIEDLEASTHYLGFVDCEIDNNGGNGISTVQSLYILNTKIHDNTTDGISISGNFNPSININNSLIYSNGVNGIDINLGAGFVIVGNVIYDNGGDGIEITPANGFLVVTNNIFRSNGAYGIGGATLDSEFGICDYNCYSNNTSGAVSWNGGTPPGNNNVTNNPLFTSETVGAEDFTLQSGSPCLDVGFGYNG